jgi:hypothetical protein
LVPVRKEKEGWKSKRQGVGTNKVKTCRREEVRVAGETLTVMLELVNGITSRVHRNEHRFHLERSLLLC